MSLAIGYRRRHDCVQKKHSLYRSAQIVFICVHLRFFFRFPCSMRSAIHHPLTSLSKRRISS
jgi:hypothetical protein